MLEFLKKLLGIKEKCCCEGTCNCKKITCDGPDLEEDFDEVIVRKDYQITIPYSIKVQLKNEDISISATKYNGNPSCVQMFKVIDGKPKYISTLKAYMNVKSFKDGNVCNFSRKNLIYKEKEN